MVSGEECTYNDTTENSNITSLQSDSNATSTNTKNAEFTKKEGQFNLNDCKCREGSVKCEVVGDHCGRLKPGQKSNDLQKAPCATSCLCHAHQINAYTLPLKHNSAARSRPFWCRFKWKPQKKSLEKKDTLYEVNLRPSKCPHYSEPFMYCKISEGIPNKRKQEAPKVTKTPEKERPVEKRVTEKIEIYYFDHGNSAYYRTTDSPPILATEKCAEKTDQAATRFWAEIFGTIHIGTAFVTAFILQFLRFVLYSIIRPLTVGVLQMLADYFIKPLLSILFNALIQPVLILLYNIATSLRDLCEPIAEAVGMFLHEIANVCAAIRIVEVKQSTAAPSTVCT